MPGGEAWLMPTDYKKQGHATLFEHLGQTFVFYLIFVIGRNKAKGTTLTWSFACKTLMA